jgi:hypothetical protein
MKTNTSDQQREREIFFLWLTAKTLANIDEKLADLVTLQQQTVDLLRRIVTEEHML